MTAAAVEATAARVLGRYELPPEPLKVFEHWRGSEGEGFVPTSRQKLLMDAVEIALSEGLFYNVDVDRRVSELVVVDPEQRAMQLKPLVEGGVFGSDVYLARKAVEARERHKLRRQVAARLGLHEGESIGRLIFSSFGGKVESAVIVNQVHATGAYTLISTRGSQKMRIDTDAIGLRDAIDAAARRQVRRTNFEQFVAERAQQRGEAGVGDAAAAVRERQRG